MVNWNYNPNDYEERDYAPIPVGDHRVRISDVEFKTSKKGNEMFEITLDVSGHNSRLWHYLVLMREDMKRTNQAIGSFFDSFGITDTDMAHYRNWIGKVGAVRVKHEAHGDATSAKVAYCISRKKQEKLAAANFGGAAPATGFTEVPTINDSELPFD